jgi:hypothetical protein
MPITQKIVTDDEFTMWRAVFAFALADGDLSIEEQKILSHHIESVPFSQKQLHDLKLVMDQPQEVEDIFTNIISRQNKQKFCALARTLVWCDGDIDLQEKQILQHVGCFKSRDALDMLKNSSTHDIYTNFTKIYENTSRLDKRSPASLFTQAA